MKEKGLGSMALGLVRKCGTLVRGLSKYWNYFKGQQKERVVFDSNIYISAFLKKRGADALLEYARDNNELYASEYIWCEVNSVLQNHLYFPSQAVNPYINELRSWVLTVVPIRPLVRIAADPRDEPILGTAIAARARYLVSHDSHLTNLGGYKEEEIDIAIIPINPQFIEYERRRKAKLAETPSL